MTPGVTTIQLPTWLLAAAGLLVILTAAIGLFGLQRLLRRQQQRGEAEPDWSLPQLDAAAGGDSPLHRWDVRCKLVGLLGFAFLIVSLQSLGGSLLACLVSLLSIRVARLPFRRALARLLAMSGFLGMFLVVMPFSAPAHPGDTLLQFGDLDWLGWNLRGLQHAGLILLKACAVALLMEPLLATAPLAVTFQGLSRLGVPAAISQMLLLAHRYSFVFRHESWRMMNGMRLRGFRGRTNLATLGSLGNFLGMLFVRSFERTDRVFDAMRARGYAGRFPEPPVRSLGRSDLLLAGFWLSLGVGLLLLDRCYLLAGG